MESERGRLARMKAVLMMDERDAGDIAWQRLAALYQRHPWRFRLILIAVATPFFLVEWFVLGWKIVALIYAAVTVGTVLTIGDAVGRVERASRE